MKKNSSLPILLGIGALAALYFAMRKSEEKSATPSTSPTTSSGSTPGGGTSAGWPKPDAPMGGGLGGTAGGIAGGERSSTPWGATGYDGATAAPPDAPAASTEAPWTRTTRSGSSFADRPAIDWCGVAREEARLYDGGLTGPLSIQVAQIGNSIMGAPSIRAMKAVTYCLGTGEWKDGGRKEKASDALNMCALKRAGSLPAESPSDSSYVQSRREADAGIGVTTCASIALPE